MHREAMTLSKFSERELLERSITAASRAASCAVNEEPRTASITTSEEAYAELERFRPASEDPGVQGVVGAARDLFELASSELGPFQGGALGSFKSPVDQPSVVTDHELTPAMAAELARMAGVVVGAASAIGKVDPVVVIRDVISGERDQPDGA